jgi:hypothetical protein
VYSVSTSVPESSFPLFSLAQAEAALASGGDRGSRSRAGQALRQLGNSLGLGRGGLGGGAAAAAALLSSSGGGGGAALSEADALRASLLGQRGAPGSASQWRLQQTQPLPMLTAADGDEEDFSGDFAA